MSDDEDELARRRAERTQHPSRLPQLPTEDLEWPDEDLSMSLDDLPAVVRARLDALQNVASEVVDELEQRGVHDLADRLRGALP